ncbi:hypothetical protein TIFTF001_016087 [Ficus carica]|uniref:Uncharacterized protein n=1 Tax=Ficus carica TaxID=3494 RepID=A0AA88D9J9_FICCA|nr:hypothetical protein TIFTF001_016087 [Ficus carica]
MSLSILSGGFATMAEHLSDDNACCAGGFHDHDLGSLTKDDDGDRLRVGAPLVSSGDLRLRCDLHLRQDHAVSLVTCNLRLRAISIADLRLHRDLHLRQDLEVSTATHYLYLYHDLHLRQDLAMS